ncbi:hypothetical protein NB689_002472 [Xanthomonas sacchari]|nr:hypothetical protein [Xanthomonas sacchari]
MAVGGLLGAHQAHAEVAAQRAAGQVAAEVGHRIGRADLLLHLVGVLQVGAVRRVDQVRGGRPGAEEARFDRRQPLPGQVAVGVGQHVVHRQRGEVAGREAHPGDAGQQQVGAIVGARALPVLGAELELAEEAVAERALGVELQRVLLVARIDLAPLQAAPGHAGRVGRVEAVGEAPVGHVVAIGLRHVHAHRQGGAAAQARAPDRIGVVAVRLRVERHRAQRPRIAAPGAGQARAAVVVGDAGGLARDLHLAVAVVEAGDAAMRHAQVAELGQAVEAHAQAVFVVVHGLLGVEQVQVGFPGRARFPLQRGGDAGAFALLQFQRRAQAGGHVVGARHARHAVAVVVPAHFVDPVLAQAALRVGAGQQHAEGAVGVDPVEQAGHARVVGVGALRLARLQRHVGERFPQFQRAERAHVDDAADRAFVQVGGGALDHFQAGDQFRRQGVVAELAAGLAGGAHVLVDRHGLAVERGHLEVGPQAAHAHVHAFAAVAHDRHAGHALQRFGHVLRRQLADVLGGDHVDHAVGVALLAQRGAEAAGVAAEHLDAVQLLDRRIRRRHRCRRRCGRHRRRCSGRCFRRRARCLDRHRGRGEETVAQAGAVEQLLQRLFWRRASAAAMGLRVAGAAGGIDELQAGLPRQRIERARQRLRGNRLDRDGRGLRNGDAGVQGEGDGKEQGAAHRRVL